MEEQTASDRRVAFSAAILLTWTAGLVDAVGFLSFDRIYTANMSGNSVALGIAIGQRNWANAFLRFWPVLTYVFGLVTGRIILQLGAHYRFRRIGTVVFLLESLLLVLAAWMGRLQPEWKPNPVTFTAIALLAISMGAQNAALTRFSSLTLHTGFVTGTLLKASSELVKVFTLIAEKLQSGSGFLRALRQGVTADPGGLSLLLWMTWLAYVFGAALGAVGLAGLKVNAIAIAIGGLLVLIALDLRAPLAVQDEQQQEKNT